MRMPGQATQSNKLLQRNHDTTTVQWVVLAALIAALIAAILINTVWSGAHWLAGVNYAVVFGAPAIATALLLLRRSPMQWFRKKQFASSSEAVSVKQTQKYSVDIGTDEIAQQISWSPVRSKTNGDERNCKISADSNAECLRFDPIFIYRYTGLVLIPVIMAGMSWIHFYGAADSNGIALVPASLQTFAYILGFAIVAAWLNDLRKPIPAAIFDKKRRVFWVEKRHVLGNKSGESAQMPISQIHALQIISYTGYEAFQQHQANLSAEDATPSIQSKDRLVYEYEVNVVFKNQMRVNILNHRNKRAIKKDAQTLAAFLDVPVWNRTTH